LLAVVGFVHMMEVEIRHYYLHHYWIVLDTQLELVARSQKKETLLELCFDNDIGLPSLLGTISRPASSTLVVIRLTLFSELPPPGAKYMEVLGVWE